MFLLVKGRQLFRDIIQPLFSSVFEFFLNLGLKKVAYSETTYKSFQLSDCVFICGIMSGRDAGKAI